MIQIDAVIKLKINRNAMNLYERMKLTNTWTIFSINFYSILIFCIKFILTFNMVFKIKKIINKSNRSHLPTFDNNEHTVYVQDTIVFT